MGLGLSKSLLMHLLIVVVLMYSQTVVPKKNVTPLPEVVNATLVAVKKEQPKPKPRVIAPQKKPVKKVVKNVIKPKPKKDKVSSSQTNDNGAIVEAESNKAAEPEPKPKGPSAEEVAQKKAAEEAQQKALLEAQKKRKKFVLTELQKYQAMIKSTIQRHLLVDEAFIGKRCVVNITLSRSGFVTRVNIVEGDDAVCRAAKNAVLKAESLPVSAENDVYQELKEINLTVEPEL